MLRFGVLATVLLLILSAQTAEARTVANLEAASFDAEGTVAGEATLRLLSTDERRQGSGPTPGALSLTASELRVETDHHQVNVSAGAVSVTPAHRWTDNTSYDQTDVHFGQSRGQSYIFLVPLDATSPPRVTWRTTSFEVQPATQENASQHRWTYSSRAPLEAELQGTLRMDAGTSTWTVEGDFLLAVWDWDAKVTHMNGVRLHQSGEQRTSIAPNPGGIHGVEEVHARQVYMTARNATLVFEVHRPNNVDIHVDDGHADVQGKAVMRDSMGTLSLGHDHPVLTEDVELTGDLQIRFGRTNGDRIPISVSGDVASATLAGSAVATGREGTSWPLFLLGSVLVPATAGGSIMARRRWQTRRLKTAEDAFDAGEYQAVLSLTKPLFRGTHGSRAAFMATVSLLHENQVEEAWRLLKQADLWPDDGYRDYLMASAHMLGGETDQAQSCVRRCIRKNEKLLREVMHNAELAPLVVDAEAWRDVS